MRKVHDRSGTVHHSLDNRERYTIDKLLFIIVKALHEKEICLDTEIRINTSMGNGDDDLCDIREISTSGEIDKDFPTGFFTFEK
jgi:hypothetical protein